MDPKKQKVIQNIKKLRRFRDMLDKMGEESHPQDINKNANYRSTTDNPKR